MHTHAAQPQRAYLCAPSLQAERMNLQNEMLQSSHKQHQRLGTGARTPWQSPLPGQSFLNLRNHLDLQGVALAAIDSDQVLHVACLPS